MYLRRKRSAIGLIAIATAIIGIALCVSVPGRVGEMMRLHAYEHTSHRCARESTPDLRVQCWLNLVHADLKRNGIASAYHMFAYIYDAYPEFGTTSCHRHAHTMGDTAYYELFIARGESLRDIQFPPEIAACGFGFFHGFLEHLIQDHPTTDFAAHTCAYLEAQYGVAMPDLPDICYHAAGHGFMQAEGDEVSAATWGNTLLLIRKPLDNCAAFTQATVKQREECREGVFNVLADWMQRMNFGVSFDKTDILKTCRYVPRADRRACYAEFGMRLGNKIKDDPKLAAAYANRIPETEYRYAAFSGMIRAMMERRVSSDMYDDTISACTTLSDAYFSSCIKSAVSGMFAHGAPGKEHDKALLACANPALVERNGRAICYEFIAKRITRTLGYDANMRVCQRFPRDLQSICSNAAASRNL